MIMFTATSCTGGLKCTERPTCSLICNPFILSVYPIHKGRIPMTESLLKRPHLPTASLGLSFNKHFGRAPNLDIHCSLSRQLVQVQWGMFVLVTSESSTI